MIGHDRTWLGAMHDLMLLHALGGLTPQRIGELVDNLTHTRIPAPLRRPTTPPIEHMSALDRAAIIAADFARATNQS